MKLFISHILVAIIFFAIGVSGAWYFLTRSSDLLPSPFISEQKKEYPYNQYTFSALRDRTYDASPITVEKELKHEEGFTSYLFSYSPMGRKVTGQLNVPDEVSSTTPVIVMVRGFVPLEIYSTGVGTKNGAAAFARAGFITMAPDFFGYGGSDSEPQDSWQARFEKPIVVIDLIKSIEQSGIPIHDEPYTTNAIGLWGHSNGGQIALSVLEITKQPYPTSLWAPVTAPFPYSVLFFSDEDEDEGKGLRLWVNHIDKDYDLRQFSVTDFLDGLLGPIQLHHGTADEAALKVWSDEFIQKIDKENDHREFVKKQYEQSATESAKADDPLLQPIDIKYYQYPGADHNLQPGWDTVVERDIAFYTKYLKH